MSTVDVARENAAHEAFWADFKRRQRADRLKQQNRGSEIMQLLKAVQEERCDTPDFVSAASPIPASTLTGSQVDSGPTVTLGLACPCVNWSLNASTRIPTQLSEVQQLLAEVQWERQVCNAAPTLSPTESSRVVPRPLATSADEARLGLQPLKRCLGVSGSSASQSLSARGRTVTHGSAAKLEGSPLSAGAKVRVPLGRIGTAGGKKLADDLGAKLAKHREKAVAKSMDGKDRSIGCASLSRNSPEQARWSLQGAPSFLARRASDRTMSSCRANDTKRYPDGGWDNRTGRASCPSSFDGFAGDERQQGVPPRHCPPPKFLQRSEVQLSFSNASGHCVNLQRKRNGSVVCPSRCDAFCDQLSPRRQHRGSPLDHGSGDRRTEVGDGGESPLSEGKPRWEPPLAPGALFRAFERCSSEECLALLARGGGHDLNGRSECEISINTRAGKRATCQPGCSVLRLAATASWLDVCQAILALPAFSEANAVDSIGWTALHVAAHSGETEICKFLLAHNRFTVAELRSHGGKTARDLAAQWGHGAIVDLFDTMATRVCVLATSNCAVPHGTVCDTASSDLDPSNDSASGEAYSGTLPKREESVGKPPAEPVPAPGALFQSFEDGDAEECLALVARGGGQDLNAKSERQITIKSRYKARTVCPPGCTVLRLTATAGWVDVCEAILALPTFSEVNAIDSAGWTALHAAAHAGELKICQLLIAHKWFTALDVTSSGGKTARALAARWGHRDIVDFLEAQ